MRDFERELHIAEVTIQTLRAQRQALSQAICALVRASPQKLLRYSDGHFAAASRDAAVVIRSEATAETFISVKGIVPEFPKISAAHDDPSETNVDRVDP